MESAKGVGALVLLEEGQKQRQEGVLGHSVKCLGGVWELKHGRSQGAVIKQHPRLLHHSAHAAPGHLTGAA